MKRRFCAADLLSTKTLFRVERGHIADMAGNPLTYTEFVTALDLERLPDGVIIKPMTGGSGSAVFKLHVVEGKLTHKGEHLDQFGFEHLIFSTNNGGYWTEFAVQETISQHPDIANFNPTSVNTVRIDTFIDAEGVVQCNAAALKVGTRGSIVDNSSAGGFMISIDLETGRLMSGAKQEAQFGGQYHDIHDAFRIEPETFIIPFWPQTREAVTKAAEALAPLRSLGWDVAITPIGPLIIEANADYGIDVLQELAGGYLGKPLGQAYLRQTR
ncbi:hypothetical protein N7E02_02040 (plasmid) [Aliirhizobium terrae]|uniref:sugar-transfer associated ATP-grasp domain-containing protein n=1 Tax=Terrirhizobium terrae TaxID=2926709 RepID=UPI002577FF14|nr:sugar-transfer associated ATP-grasp domain-containing protein [Rhizobium sp. CC-CFT758]WJH37637.1 hypothetical protein N7E02_02040 [Rhizobium sp. CC-CFT758]